MPPIVNTTSSPMANSMAVVKRSRPPHIGANQLRTLTPVGMAKEPEQVLPQEHVSAGRGYEELGAQVAVEQEHDLPGGQRRKRQNDQAGGGHHHPHKDWHAPGRHAWCAQLDGGHHQVEGGEDGSDAAEADAQIPAVHTQSGLELEWMLR